MLVYSNKVEAVSRLSTYNLQRATWQAREDAKRECETVGDTRSLIQDILLGND